MAELEYPSQKKKALSDRGTGHVVDGHQPETT